MGIPAPIPNDTTERGVSDATDAAAQLPSNTGPEAINREATVPIGDTQGITPEIPVSEPAAPPKKPNLNTQEWLLDIIMEDSPADTAKKRAMEKLAKLGGLEYKIPPSKSPQGPSRTTKSKTPRKFRKRRRSTTSSSKLAGSVKASPESQHSQTISVDTTTLVKHSLREHFWQPVKVREVKLSTNRCIGRYNSY